MADYQYSQVYGNDSKVYPPEESEMRTTLASPWSPRAPAYTSYAGAQDPLMQQSPYIGEASTPHHLQTRFSYLKPTDQHSLERTYSSKRQLFRLLRRVIFRFLVTLLLCAAIVGTFILYEREGVLDQDQKHMFNAIFIGLSLLLSTNLVSAFKSMASMIKWRLLATSKHTLREVDLILGLASFQKVLELLWTWTRGSTTVAIMDQEENRRRRRWAFRLGAFAWILLGLGVQIVVALVGLTFNHESEGAIGYIMGPVNITEMRYISLNYTADVYPTLSDQKYAAHIYGIMSTNYHMEEYSPDADASSLLYNEDSGAWTYYFRDWATVASTNSNQMVSVVSNRSLNINPVCEWSAIIEGQYGEADVDIVLLKNNKTQTIDWMKESSPDVTVVVNPVWEESGPNPLLCGPRCSRIYMFQFVDPAGPTIDGDFFNCTVEVAQVQNGDPAQPQHQLPDNTALLIGGAAGTEGFKDAAGRQYSKYNRGSMWGAAHDSGPWGEMTAAWIIGRFSVGVVAAYDQYGPTVESSMGIQSWIGVTLVVKWWNLYLSLGIILTIELGLGIFVAFKANSVYCKDDSFLSTARLLRPLMERLGPSGSVCDGKVLASTFNRKVVYGVRTFNNIHHLDVGEDIVPLRGKFPTGQYD